MNQLPATGSSLQAPRRLPRSKGSAALGLRSLSEGGWLWVDLYSCLLSLLVLSLGGLCARPAAGQVAPPSNRYLLIVDVSQAMEARQRGTVKVVEELLKSGMSGQMKPGDTLGVWTFNAELYGGRFPLQHWSSDEQMAITTRLLTFLRGQKCEKLANLTNVLTAMERVIKDSHPITVILVAAGDRPISGTPFDNRINEFCQQWHEQQKAVGMPFVIVLRARDGEIADYSLNTPPWPVQVACFPAETQVTAAPAANRVSEAQRQVQLAATPPRIISAKQSKRLQSPKA